MNREEAARVLTKEADGWGDERVLFETYKTALRMGAAALRGPQPDPETGLVPCRWCGPERIGWFSVQFWVRACYGKRKWMSVTQDWKKKVKYCPMCGRKLGVEE